MFRALMYLRGISFLFVLLLYIYIGYSVLDKTVTSVCVRDVGQVGRSIFDSRVPL